MGGIALPRVSGCEPSNCGELSIKFFFAFVSISYITRCIRGMMWTVLDVFYISIYNSNALQLVTVG